jgi:hypothetical protein
VLTLNVKSDLNKLTAALTRLEHQQLPFATAQALTAVARKVAHGETEGIAQTFKSPTPFTMNAVAVIPALKATQTAVVFVKDIQAAYLLPYVTGGPQVLGRKQAMLTPRDIDLNQYGNLPRGKLASLKGRPDLFVGQVKTKSGAVIGGVFQRVAVSRTGRIKRGKGARGRFFSPTQGRLKLLVQFTRPAEVTHRWAYGQRAAAIVKASLQPAFSAAMAKALATAR